MFYIVIAGICLAVVSTPISAQLQQNSVGQGVQPTNNITVAKVPVGWGSPPPPPPGGWPAPPPPPPGWPAPPAPGGWDATTPEPSTPTYCETIQPAPVGNCPPIDGPDPTYLATTDCFCFYECSNGYAYLFDCPGTLVWDPSIDNCVYSTTDCPNFKKKIPTHSSDKSVPKKL